MTRFLHDQKISDLLRRSARRYPEKPAIRCGSVQWSYAQFQTLTEGLAAGLVQCGVGRGDRVAILARNSHAFAALRFALAAIDAVLVPLNYMLTPLELGYILRHAGATLLCHDAEFATPARMAAAEDTAVTAFLGMPAEDSAVAPTADFDFDELCQTARRSTEGTFEGVMQDAIGKETPSVSGGNELAQIIYTSGTESLPKGAMLSHAAVIWQYVSCIVDGEIATDDVLLHAMPLFHCAQLDVFLGPAVYVGATNVITSRPVAERVLTLLEEHQITSFFAPPSVWIGLLRSGLFDTVDLSCLRKGYYGASIMPVEVLLEMQRRLPSVRLWNFYGQTEIAPLATVLKPEDQLRKAGSAGRAALNVETRVVDDAGRTVALGEVGEIVHRSPQLLAGYFNDPERTATAFEGGWFHSGDLATIDAEGYITVVDRKKDMIKTGGENVASREVEEVIYRQEGVSEVAVIGLPHPRWIEGVTAVVVLKEGASVSDAQIVAHCAAHLAPFKVPKAVVFVASLPRNPSGKLLKRDLRDQLRELYARSA